MSRISRPPEFMPPDPGNTSKPIFFGYWSPKDSKDANAYLPIVSKKVWKDKGKFLDAVSKLEDDILHPPTDKYYSLSCRGRSPSRLEDGVYLGFVEFWDTEAGVAWPEQYARYYIGKWNVMPTKAFFDYILYRMKNPLRRKRSVGRCPSHKIMNPKTNRCVLKNGKVGREILATQK